MAVQTPIPPNPIGENFAWRDWLQQLSDRVFGTASTLDVPIEPEFGGTGLTTYNTGDIIYSNSTNNLTRLPPPASTSLLQMTAAGVPSWTASSGIVTSVTGTSPVASSGGTTPVISLSSGYGDTLNPYASKTANFVLAAPNGSAGVPTFRAVVAADIPTLNQNTSGSAGSVVNSLTSGTGISYSSGTTYNGSTAITINNSGVTSIVAGTGISVSSATGAVTVSQSSTTTKAYGSFYDTTTQTATVINTAYAMTFNTTALSSSVSRGSPTSRIVTSNAGVYNFQFSAQLHKTSASVGYVYIWFRVNGTDITDSASKVALSGSQAETVAAWNYVASMAASDYFEIMWSTDNTDCQLLRNTTVSPVPGIPSVILTVQQI
jgi:hypothetical protein